MTISQICQARIGLSTILWHTDVNRTYLSKLEKGASYPGLEITRRHARHGRAAARTDKTTADKMLNKDFRNV